MPKVATLAICTNSFTSPARRFLTAARPGRSSGIFEQFFVSTQKTSAVESSSHAPSRASGRLSRGAAHFFVVRSVGWMEEKMAHLSKRVLDQGMLEDR